MEATRTKARMPSADESRWSLPVHQERSRATRDRLLTAAERVFETKGYEGSRIADIASSAGCSVGAVYVRFKDKEALFNGIVEDFIAEGALRIASTVASRDTHDPAALIRTFIRGAAEQFSRHRGMFRAILERGFDDPTALEPVMGLRKHLEDLLESAMRVAFARKHTEARLSIRVATQIIFGFLLNTALNPFSPTKNEGPRALAELEIAVLKYLDLV